MCELSMIQRILLYYLSLAVVIDAVRPPMTLKTFRRRFACWTARYNCLHFHNVWLDDIDGITQPEALPQVVPLHPSAHSRILVAVAAYDLDSRGAYVNKMLKNFATVCNAGYDVQIIVHTATMQRDSLLKTLPTCSRTGQKLAVAFEELPKSVGHALTSAHRMAFAKHIHDYDYFIYMEDDLDFQLSHLQYLVETYADLQDTKLLLPGLIRVEHSNGNLAANPEENVVLYPEPYFPAQVFKHRSRIYASAYNGYQAMVFLPRAVLLPHATDPAWVRSESEAPDWLHGTYRAYQAGLWLHEFNYSLVHPVDCFPRCLLHHMPNNYLLKGDDEYPTDYKVPLGTVLHSYQLAIHGNATAVTSVTQLAVSVRPPRTVLGRTAQALQGGAGTDSRTVERLTTPDGQAAATAQDEAQAGWQLPGSCLPGVLVRVRANVTEEEVQGMHFNCCQGRYSPTNATHCRLEVCHEPREFGREHTVLCKRRDDMPVPETMKL